MAETFDHFLLERQVGLLFRNTYLGQTVSVINAALLAWVASEHVQPALLVVWLVAVAAMSTLRMTQASAYDKLSDEQRHLECGAWRERARLGVFGSALVWAFGSLFLMLTGNTGLQLFTAFVAAGMTAGAVPVLAADRRAFRTYAWPIVLAATLGSLGNDPLHFAFTAMSLLFLTAITRSADYFHDALHDSLRLEYEKQGLLDQLSVAKQRVEQSDRAKTEFLANISHELRTPMNGIIGMTELLSLEPLSDEQLEMLHTVSVSADQLALLINNMLELSALEAGHIGVAPTPFSPAELVDALREEFAPAAARKGLTLQVKATEKLPHLVVADLVKIKRILGHLVGNAVKFTDSGQIDVSIKVSGAPPALDIAVSDTGPGISREKLVQLSGGFFVQGDGSVIRRHGGTGIGIPLARKLAGLLGGHLEIQSTPGKGSCFTISIPVSQADAGTVTELAANPSLPEH